MSAGFEYRIRWKREGKQWVRVLRQTLQAAQRVARVQETAHEDMLEWEIASPPPPLTDGPFIEVRSVGEWQPLASATGERSARLPNADVGVGPGQENAR